MRLTTRAMMRRATLPRQTPARLLRRTRRPIPALRPATRLRLTARPMQSRPLLAPLPRFPPKMASVSERAGRLVVGLGLTTPPLFRMRPRFMRMSGLRPASAPVFRAALISGLLPISVTGTMRTTLRLLLSRARRAHRSSWTMPCALNLTASACAYALPMQVVTSSTVRLRAATTKS